MPLPGFPTSLPEFVRRFPDERACFDYLVEARWPGAWECPGCGHDRWYPRKGRLAVECAKCCKVLTATAGTVMHGSRQPLCSWLLAAFLLVVDKRGVSAVQLQRALGIKRHEVAYQMLHKLRAAMVAPEHEPLRGVVEVDETLVGGIRRGAGKGTWKGAQQVVVGAIEVRGGTTPGRVRLRHLLEGREALAVQFLKENVEPDATVRTDGGYLYKNLLQHGFNHDVVSMAHGAKQEEVLPTLHLAFSNLKAWLQGTFHGAVRKEHLQAYLNEFTFRFNRRKNLHAAFQRILGIGTSVEGPTYAGIYGGTWAHPAPGRRRRTHKRRGVS